MGKFIKVGPGLRSEPLWSGSVPATVEKHGLLTPRVLQIQADKLLNKGWTNLSSREKSFLRALQTELKYTHNLRGA